MHRAGSCYRLQLPGRQLRCLCCFVSRLKGQGQTTGEARAGRFEVHTKEQGFISWWRVEQVNVGIKRVNEGEWTATADNFFTQWWWWPSSFASESYFRCFDPVFKTAKASCGASNVSTIPTPRKMRIKRVAKIAGAEAIFLINFFCITPLAEKIERPWQNLEVFKHSLCHKRYNDFIIMLY